MAGFNYINESGVVVVDTLTTLAESQQEFKDAAGDQNLTVDAGPLSVLINSYAEIKDGVARSNAQMANQINPRNAGGVMLSSIMALTGSEITAASSTRVTATITGIAGTEIPAGSKALTNPTITTIQYSFSLEAAVIIGVGGTVDADFLADEVGPIIIPANSLTSIGTPAIGWLSVDNVAAGITGKLQQSDSQARFSRIEQIGVQSSTLPERTYGAVSAINDVKSLTYYNNTSTSPVAVGGRTIDAQTQYVCADGGSAADITEALAKAQSGGCGWTGTQTGVYSDTYSFEDYTVKWDETAPILIDVEMTVKPSGSFQNPESVTKDAIIAYADGLIDGFRGLVTGAEVNPFEMVESANVFSPAINAIKCRVALDGGALGFNNLIMQIDQKGSVIEANITVVIT